MKPLLLLTDFSENGNHAVDYGYHLAKLLKANVLLCNAVNLTDQANVLWPIEANQGLVTDSTEALRKIKTRLEEADDDNGFRPKIECWSTLGKLVVVVADLQRTKFFEMVVIGAHRTGFGRFLVENHCKSMIDALDCPLLIVPREAPRPHIRKIAFATDYKNHEQDLDRLYSLIPMADRLEASILLAHIHKGELINIKKKEEAFLTELSNKADYPHIFYSCIEHDQADDGLCDMCDHRQIDILVMRHRSRDFLEMIFNQSNTHKVAARVKVPLMVLPE